MYENAYEILNYLPIDANDLEKIYINNHLFAAFQVVNEEDEPVRAFSILPFHLLFMFSIQYKVYRISAYKKEEYLEVLNFCNLRDKGNKEVLEQNPPIASSNGNIPNTCSVRNLSLIPEKQIFDFFTIINVDQETIESAKELVRIRSTYAHANGNIEEDIEDKIEEYLKVLRTIQLRMLEVNKNTQNWIDEIEEGESLEDFFKVRFLQSQFSPYDFGDVISTLLESDKLDEEQWYQVVGKGLELSYNETISALRYILINDLDKDRRANALIILQKEGDIDEGI